MIRLMILLTILPVIRPVIEPVFGPVFGPVLGPVHELVIEPVLRPMRGSMRGPVRITWSPTNGDRARTRKLVDNWPFLKISNGQFQTLLRYSPRHQWTVDTTTVSTTTVSTATVSTTTVVERNGQLEFMIASGANCHLIDTVKQLIDLEREPEPLTAALIDEPTNEPERIEAKRIANSNWTQ